MTTVIFNRAEARAFARVLDEKYNEMRSANAEISRKLQELYAEGWQDDNYSAFVKNYEEHSLRFVAFLERSQKLSEYLKRKAAAADKYKDGRR